MRVDNLIQESEKRIVLRGEIEPSVAPVIDKAVSKGWKSITVQGNAQLCRATWFEGKMAGLEVLGYNATREDHELLKRMHKQKDKNLKTTLSARDIFQDYNARVVPYLQKRYEDLRRKRSTLGITTTDLDRAYGINLPTGYARIIDEQFEQSKECLLRAMSDRDSFASLGRQEVAVRYSYEDGIARFVSKGAKQKSLQYGENQGLSKRRS